MCPTAIQPHLQTPTPQHEAYEIIGNGESCAKPGIPTVPPMERMGANYVLKRQNQSVVEAK
jgi:hypothetical protein